MDIEKRFKLINRNTEDIVTETELREVLKKKNPKAYIGFAVTGKVHIGYFIPMMKIADFVNADFKFTILLADLHAHLDDRKAPFELLDWRAKYYKEVSLGLLKALGVDTKNIEFVKGSDYQLDKKYTTDMYRMAATCTLERCRRAASEVVRFGDTPKLSGFIYPIMQALDEEYLEVDVQYGGIDQRKILMFARESLPKLGYKQRVEVMTPMLPGLQGAKMSASVEGSKIDVLDSKEEVVRKINSAYCPAGEIEENGVMAFVKHVIMVIKEDNKEEFVIKRPEKFGGNLSYSDYKLLERDFLENKLHPQDLKTAVAEEINEMLEHVRKRFEDKKALLRKAFPD
ncbi:MAG: tyrosine--tRNA ligase [Nanoarchaeota archaeon]